MDLFIQTPTTILAREGEWLVLKDGEREERFLPRYLSNVRMGEELQCSVSVLNWLGNQGTRVQFLDGNLKPVAGVLSYRFDRQPSEFHAQWAFNRTSAGREMAIGWIRDKLANQIGYLERLHRRKKIPSEKFGKWLNKIRAEQDRLVNLDTHDDHFRTEPVFAGEARAARAYFRSLNLFLPPEWQFKKREKRPAMTPFNAILNYSNSFLYREIEQQCRQAGIDPFAGILHSTRRKKMALVFDLIEPFRVSMEDVTMNILRFSSVKKADFDVTDGMIRIGASMKKLVATDALASFRQRVDYQGRRASRRDHIRRTIMKYRDTIRATQ